MGNTDGGKIYLVEIFDKDDIAKLSELHDKHGLSYAYIFRKGLRLFLDWFEKKNNV